MSLAFQSTHPLRGATGGGLFPRRCFLFQSTHPLRGATLFRAIIAVIERISIHAPLAGCDPDRHPRRDREPISIHAPLAGCDAFSRQPEFKIEIFQSTHPLRGATVTLPVDDILPYISIHAPLAGCDACRRARRQRAAGFQSTHPLRGATGAGEGKTCTGGFQSTHPLRGATCISPSGRCSSRFQSTHPLRGATQVGGYFPAAMAISIHAPLAGCDRDVPDFFHPDGDFNPRTPCGVRHG